MFKNPFSFDGRIRRLEYGLSNIIYFFVVVIISLLTESSGNSPDSTTSLLTCGLLVPMVWFMLAQGAKRCHDRDNSGWWQLIPFYGFVMLFAEGEPGDNEYGPNPKDIRSAEERDPFARKDMDDSDHTITPQD